MKRFFLIILLLASVLLFGCTKDKNKNDSENKAKDTQQRPIHLLNKVDTDNNAIDCKEQKSQSEMNICAKNKAEEEITRLEKILTDLKKVNNDNLIISSQDSWKQYRDQTCKLESKQYEEGSMQPLIEWSCIERITNKRVEELENFYNELQR
ncbi:DUF1311 domain-containing protein [Candidatus Dojkabacteria bacterium]|nr:DUF1311 domain-containing protein [Candidatus Dojkabacteria bacterium]